MFVKIRCAKIAQNFHSFHFLPCFLVGGLGRVGGVDYSFVAKVAVHSAVAEVLSYVEGLVMLEWGVAGYGIG